jgi:glycine cleavage system H protein
MNPSDRKYTREHEWVKLEEGYKATVGITHYAQEQLGDIVYLNLPQAGAKLEQNKALGEVESVKAVSEIFAPVSGEVVEVNQEVLGHPELINQDPYGKGWLLRITVRDLSELEGLMTAQEYEAFLEQGG